jgi:hypothetical protein
LPPLETGLLHRSRFFKTIRLGFDADEVVAELLSTNFFLTGASPTVGLSNLSNVISNELSVSCILHDSLIMPGLKSTSVADELHISDSLSLSVSEAEDVG